MRTSFDRTIGLERSVELARAWNMGDSGGFENWLREITNQLYELGDRAARVEQGEKAPRCADGTGLWGWWIATSPPEECHSSELALDSFSTLWV
jgi:hypothetical protein